MLSLLLFWTSLPSQRFWGRVKRSYFSVCISKLIWFLDSTEGEGGKETCTFPAFCFFSFLVFPWRCWSVSDYWTGRKLPILKKKGIGAEEKERKRRRGKEKWKSHEPYWRLTEKSSCSHDCCTCPRAWAGHHFTAYQNSCMWHWEWRQGFTLLVEAVLWLAAWHPTNPFHFISCIF